MYSLNSRAGTTVTLTIVSSGFWGFDGGGRLNCFPHPQSYCYEVVVTATRANDVTITGGNTSDGLNYTVNVTDNFSIYNNGSGDPQIILTVFDGSNNGNGSNYTINALGQIAGDDQNPAFVQYQ